MSGTEIDMEKLLGITPVELLKEIAQGVAEAQCQLDAEALSRQVSLLKDHPDLAHIGYQPSWLQMSEVDVELKMVLHYVENKQEPKKSGILAALFNAGYKNTMQYEAEGASTMKVRFVPIPPPVVPSTGTSG